MKLTCIQRSFNGRLRHQKVAGKQVSDTLFRARGVLGNNFVKDFVDACPVAKDVVTEFVSASERATPRRTVRAYKNRGPASPEIHAIHRGLVAELHFNTKTVCRIKRTRRRCTIEIQLRARGESCAKRLPA